MEFHKNQSACLKFTGQKRQMDRTDGWMDGWMDETGEMDGWMDVPKIMTPHRCLRTCPKTKFYQLIT